VQTKADREIEGETTRVEAVRYLQGSLGHATASLFLIFVGGVVWLVGYRTFGWFVVGAFILSANGLSIWAWHRLVAYFTRRAEQSADGPTRTLRAEPLSTDSTVEMKAGAVMTLLFLVTLLVVRFGLVYSPRVFGFLSVGFLTVGNAVALVFSYYSR